jgi:anti-sigma B factor antagonist
MIAPSAKMSVWVGEAVVFVKVAGRANYASSVDFKALVHGLRQKGHDKFVLDLSECQLMDSTFLGVLAGLGQKMMRPSNGEREPGISLCNPSPRISDLLVNLGVADLFKVVTRPAGADRFQPVAAVADVDKKEVSKTCLEAHTTLMELNPANVPKFKDVAAFLAEDLKRMEDAEETPKAEG